VFVPGALFGVGDPHAVISDGIACGTGVECAATARLRFDVLPVTIARPRIETPQALHIVGFGPDLDTAARDAIEQGIGRAPEEMEWFAAFGLVVTLIWLYIEILRLLRKLRG
jgi:acetamidase/formamidase